MRKLPDLAWEVKKCFQEEGIAKTWWRRGCSLGDQIAAEVLRREERATGHCNSSEGPEKEIGDEAVRMKVEVSDVCDLPPDKVLWKPDLGGEEIRGKDVMFTEVILFKATVCHSLWGKEKK